MCRWFGYRPGYENLCRVYMSKISVLNFNTVLDATEDLKAQFREMDIQGKTPRDFGLMVKESPDILETTMLVTSRNKYGSSQEIVRTLNYSAKPIDTSKLYKDKLKNQKPVEKQKFKADNLLSNGALKPAILIYQSILQAEIDETVDKKFYGRVYASLGSAYGRMFLYEEAAKMYESAFQICEEESMLKAYLYACYRYLPKQEYEELLQKSQVYQGVDNLIQEEIEELEGKLQMIGFMFIMGLMVYVLFSDIMKFII